MFEYPLHHIGVATKDFEKELSVFERLGYSQSSDYFSDPAQKIHGVFLSAAGQPTLELLANIDDSGPLTTFLRQGIKFYHFAYEVAKIEQACADVLHKAGAKLVTPITSAVVFSKLCFVMLPNMMLIELVQRR